ncbi:AraC family transcriptional regulator [Paenibacillus sp. PsM32]|uniref:AraC family transcriptional regulator n=1 Tax=Paenibacillus sp. PsM32 TaxID=3030536 RepID=UPI00263AAE5A|nr:AraC family transcriptional regulator [Paenibacillus sp. PsM32]MDN4618299.1 AraC family transcriptional regulator [Paenibacillus sp. PsM32]
MKIKDPDTSVVSSDLHTHALDIETSKLAHAISTLAPHEGTVDLSKHIPGLHVSRYSYITPDTIKTFFSTSLIIVAQGAKAITIENNIFSFGKSHMILLPIALPLDIQITETSLSDPYLGIKLELDPQKLSELVLKLSPAGLSPVRQQTKGHIADTDVSMINAAIRLLECLQNEEDRTTIAPLILEEIMIRVLRSPIGVSIAETGFGEVEVQRIAKVIDWLREHFSQPIKVAELAELAHMSPSSFHVHFKSVTSMSPLQYQKTLRLHEARRLMLANALDANTACRLVGYVSDSQFSRDYSRFFGNPPSRDIARLRQNPQMVE